LERDRALQYDSDRWRSSLGLQLQGRSERFHTATTLRCREPKGQRAGHRWNEQATVCTGDAHGYSRISSADQNPGQSPAVFPPYLDPTTGFCGKLEGSPPGFDLRAGLRRSVKTHDGHREALALRAREAQLAVLTSSSCPQIRRPTPLAIVRPQLPSFGYGKDPHAGKDFAAGRLHSDFPTSIPAKYRWG